MSTINSFFSAFPFGSDFLLLFKKKIGSKNPKGTKRIMFNMLCIILGRKSTNGINTNLGSNTSIDAIPVTVSKLLAPPDEAP